MNDILAPLATFGLTVLGWAVLHFLWQGALLGGVVEAILFGLRRARPVVRERVALFGLVGLLFVFGATVTRLASFALTDLRVGIEAGFPLRDVAMQIDHGFAARLGAIAPFAGLAWLALVVVRALQFAVAARALRRLRDGAIALHTGEIVALVRDLADRLGVRRAVSVGISSAVDVPTLAGWRSPVILLPVHALHEFPANALAGVVAHELAHVRRHDVVVQAFLVTARALLSLHPCAHRLARVAEHEREIACDDAALQAGAAPLHYARTLVQLERLRPRRTSLAVAATHGPLRDRVQRIVHPVPTLDRRRAWGIAVAGVVLAAAMGLTSVRAARSHNLDTRPVLHAAMRFAAHRADFLQHQHAHSRQHALPDAHRRIVLREVTKAPEPRAP